VSGIRLLVADDNPHVAWSGRAHPVNATFHRFLAALLELPEAPVRELVHAVPTRAALGPPHNAPVDERIRVVATAPFDGIGGFLRHARSVTRANRAILRPEIEAADLVWLKVPASNAALAARLASQAGTPRFGWVAGSARGVAAAQPRNPVARAGAVAVGLAYDIVGRLAAGDRRIVVGRDIVERDGLVASLVEPSEVRDTGGQPWVVHDPIRLVWAGRVAEGKGLTALLELMGVMPGAELVMLGEGPARRSVEGRARRLGVANRIEWRGFVGDREAYLDALAAADILVHPSPAEGFPKVVLDAMAVGTPVVAAPAGGLAELARARLIAPIRRRAPAHPATSAVMSLLRDPDTTQAMRERAASFAAAHTRPAEAARLVARLQQWFPELPWPQARGEAGAHPPHAISR
jgi:glycosyltransferase involved in cell wall biosynthesis